MKKFIPLLVLILLAIPVFAQDTKVSMYLQDNANLFSPQQAQLVEQSLRDFEDQTSVQFVIFTTDKIPDDTTLEEYSLKIAEDNKIGRSGLDTGLLFFIAVDDRKYRWEVGYGLEDVLNSAWLGSMSRDYMVPYFKSNDYSDGILAGMKAVMQRTLNTEDSDILPKDINVDPVDQDMKNFYNLMGSLIFIIIFFSILAFIIAKNDKKRGRGSLPAAFYIGAASGMFRGGGGFGGFSGGGGGFGGGGFSGGW